MTIFVDGSRDHAFSADGPQVDHVPGGLGFDVRWLLPPGLVRSAAVVAFYHGSPSGGVFFQVHDLDGWLGAFRGAAIPPASTISCPPHITIVHPRTSALGEQAWAELAACNLSIRFTVTCVAIPASDGDRWPALRVLHLAPAPGGRSPRDG